MYLGYSRVAKFASYNSSICALDDMIGKQHGRAPSAARRSPWFGTFLRQSVSEMHGGAGKALMVSAVGQVMLASLPIEARGHATQADAQATNAFCSE